MKAINARILVVEDDLDLREALIDTLSLAGFSVLEADCGEAALPLLAQQHVDMVVSDVNMGEMDGHQLLDKIKQDFPHIPVLLITAYGSISRSVDAIRAGAVDYLVKPFEPRTLVDVVSRHVGFAGQSDNEPVAVEASSQQLLQLAQRVAVTDSTVLISGESGTGKEVLARYIHSHSPRSKKPFIAINCAAIPENMLEATLFGYEKGAYTGAYNSAPGKFEQANGGTLLLDEISEMDLALQAKLLRVLQEREVERLGGRKTIPLDVRIIATTNRHMQEEVAANRFREDLYYRLSVFPLQWLSLRQRPADIVPIANRLLGEHCEKMRRARVTFDQSAETMLRQYNWPGNVRELDNVVQRALIMQPGNVISAAHLRIDPYSTAPLADSIQFADNSPVPAIPETSTIESSTAEVFSIAGAETGLGDDLKKREFQIIIDMLKLENGSRKSAAEKLGISPRTLRYKLARMRESGINLDAALSA